MKAIIFFVISLVIVQGYSQEEDLLNSLESEILEEPEYIVPAFKAMKIGNLQSTKVAKKKDIYMYVSHRFGTLKDGVSTFFGLDNANTKIQMIYGVSNHIQIGLSRESLRKTYAGSLKLKHLEQGSNGGVNISSYFTVNINTLLSKQQYPLMKYWDRYSYTSQLLISKKFTKKLSLEIAPSYVRQNLVLEPFQKHEQFVTGIGGRYKLSNRVSLNMEYALNFSRAEQSVYNDPFTVGIDLETGGHVFQLLFSNAQSTNEPGFLSNAEGSWAKGDIFFGFNIVRTF